MASDLYETLDIPRDATLEQIRKAYKKKALQTHPDRLAPTATAEEKAASEELFRKVNNAYEVLSDPQNRRVYDLHGVWPPPEPDSTPLPRRGGEGHRPHPRHRSRAFGNNTFTGPFFADPFPFSFTFSDPFTLFDSIFGFDSHHHHSQQRRHRSSPWNVDLFQELEANLDDIPDMRHGGGFEQRAFGSPFGITTPEDRGWAGESFTTTTINGVTQSIHKRRDWSGNEHVTRTYPDGRKIQTVNGVEQSPPPRGYIPHHTSHPDQRYAPPTAGVSQPRLNSWSATPLPPYPPPPYSGHGPIGYGSTPTLGNDPTWFHDRQYTDAHPVIPDTYTSERPNFDRQNSHHHQRKRWRSGRG